MTKQDATISLKAQQCVQRAKKELGPTATTNQVIEKALGHIELTDEQLQALEKLLNPKTVWHIFFETPTVTGVINLTDPDPTGIPYEKIEKRTVKEIINRSHKELKAIWKQSGEQDRNEPWVILWYKD